MKNRLDLVMKKIGLNSYLTSTTNTSYLAASASVSCYVCCSVDSPCFPLGSTSHCCQHYFSSFLSLAFRRRPYILCTLDGQLNRRKGYVWAKEMEFLMAISNLLMISHENPKTKLYFKEPDWSKDQRTQYWKILFQD